MNKNNNVKKEFYINTLNSSLSLLLLGFVGIMIFYYFDFPILFNIMKSIFYGGIFALVLSFFKSSISVYFQDKLLILILILSLFFSFNNNFNIKTDILTNEISQLDKTVEEDLQIDGRKKVKRIIIKYDLEKEISEKIEEVDIKEEISNKNIKKIFSENKDKKVLQSYLKNIEDKEIISIINLIFLNQNKREISVNDFENIKFIFNMFYMEKNGVVVTGKVDYKNNLTIKILPKKYVFKPFFNI